MSGTGQRFRRAGYTTPKTLLKAEGMPVIEHVVRMFPGPGFRFLFVVNETHAEETELLDVLKRIAPEAHVEVIPGHKLGPVHAVLAAAEHIPDDEPVVVNYCDFSVAWDAQDFARVVTERGVDGCITTYRGFHPHSLGPTLYAYARTEGDRVLELKEKHHFTDDRMQEHASSGTYHFASGALVKRYFRQLMDEGPAVNGEFYVSSVYDHMLADGLEVIVYELDQFLQWGTPEDWEEYQGWSTHFAEEAGFRPTRPLGGQVLVPMAGAGARFAQKGYTTPKPLIVVGHGVGAEAMVVRSARSLPKGEQHVFVVRREHMDDPAARLAERLEAAFPGAELVVAPELTAGQLSSCLLARDALDPEAPLTIGPSDSALVWDEAAFAALVADPTVDAVAFTFRDHPHANRNPASYGWVRTEGDRVTGVSVKAAISDTPRSDPGITGAFWFRRAGDFLAAADRTIAEDRRVRGEFYADSVLEALVEQGKDARVFDVTRYVCWGTPDDLHTWEYWERYFAGADHHPYARPRAPEAQA
jgi:bifunctional N-acetylglucosamine-1-phosphate-uridyltransferase/glucosamine-1-phosphate-acetyltransferase GlmU-like protein